MIEKNIFLISQSWVRIAGTTVFGIALFFFVLPMFVGIRHAGCYAGTIISILGIVYFALNPVIAHLMQKIWERDFGHFLLCIFLGILALGGLIGLTFSFLMIRAECNQPETPATVLILGCKVRRDGAPTLMLKKRLDAGAAYLEQHPEVSVIVCGGQGSDEVISEAECMKNYLIQEKKINPERIYQEDRSTSTQENFENAKEILDVHELGSQIIIVTDGYHQYRASRIADGLNLECTAVSARTSWYLVPSYWVREWLGICYQFVFG
ncbi:MAG: YdcF family protein [Oscillospiraceae bacterium]|nr:YdcF family protein [Oscillospiraceae bacterium]